MESTSHIVILASTFPGDLVASRTLLVAVRQRTSATVAVRRQLLPLIRDIVVDPIAYDMPWPVDVWSDAFEQTLEDLRLPAGATLLDLVGTPPTMRWIERRKGRSIGYRVCPDEQAPYERMVEWCIPPGRKDDPTHFGVRLLRALPGHEDATRWPSELFPRALYPYSPAGNTIALAPGCGRGAEDKRMPSSFWTRLAAWARAHGRPVTWFLGPDEIDMASALVETGDGVIDGDWDDVLVAHAQSCLGVTNDTCHMHIRAHQRRPTFALFRRPEVAEWGDYPGLLTCLGPPTSLSEEGALAQVLTWLDAQLDG